MSRFAVLGLAATLAFGGLCAGSSEYSYKVERQPAGWSKAFLMDGKHTSDAGVRKSFWRIRHCYDLVDDQGNPEGEGIRRKVFSAGIFMNSMAEIDLYDENGQLIGMIDGQYFTDARAQFALYHYDSIRGWQLRGVAYLQNDSDEFKILTAKGAVTKLAAIKHKGDYWKVKVYVKDRLDKKLLRCFAAFVADNETTFCRH